MSRLRHRNVERLVKACDHKRFKTLEKLNMPIMDNTLDLNTKDKFAINEYWFICIRNRKVSVNNTDR